MTSKADILSAIRRKCLDCCYQTAEIRECPVSTCGLWPYRLGMDPEPSRTRGFAKSPVYTAGFEESEPLPARASDFVRELHPTSASRGLLRADPAQRALGGYMVPRTGAFAPTGLHEAYAGQSGPGAGKSSHSGGAAQSSPAEVL